MPKDYSSIPINELRRKDRSADESFIKTFLHESPFCSIANINDNQPFIHSNIFVYDEQNHAIYFHTAKEGRFRFNIESNSKVCFSIAEMGRLLPAEVALEFSVEYKSVVTFSSTEGMIYNGKFIKGLKPDNYLILPNINGAQLEYDFQ